MVTLEEAIGQATERKDIRLANKIADFIDDGLPPSLFDYDEFDDPFDVPFDDPFGSVPPGLPPGIPVDVLLDVEKAGERALELLETHSHQETVDILVKEFGKSAMAKKLPKGALRMLFNALVEEAAGLPEIQPPPRKKRGGRAGR
jgi:hypothetical protein